MTDEYLSPKHFIHLLTHIHKKPYFTTEERSKAEQPALSPFQQTHHDIIDRWRHFGFIAHHFDNILYQRYIEDDKAVGKTRPCCLSVGKLLSDGRRLCLTQKPRLMNAALSVTRGARACQMMLK